MSRNLILLTVASLLFFSGIGIVYLALVHRADQGVMRSPTGEVWKTKRMMNFGGKESGEYVAVYSKE